MNYELIRARPEGPCQLNIALPTHFLAHPPTNPILHFVGRERKAKMAWHKNDCVC